FPSSDSAADVALVWRNKCDEVSGKGAALIFNDAFPGSTSIMVFSFSADFRGAGGVFLSFNAVFKGFVPAEGTFARDDRLPDIASDAVFDAGFFSGCADLPGFCLVLLFNAITVAFIVPTSR
ncbi:MAG TPA: hypothetical protein VLL97_02370, partial [Acidobacteriota bacterium]|nr:hypothetical protein [Acidobacteriota bacterium]